MGFRDYSHGRGTWVSHGFWVNFIFMRLLSSSLIGLTCLGFVLLSASCGVNHGPVVHHRRENRVLHKWYDDGGEGKVTIRISLSDQIAEFKRGGRDIGWCYVATGKEGHDTAPGNYKITEKIADKHSNIYGWFEDEFGNVTDGDAKASQKVPEGMVYVPAPMPYWMRLTSYGVGMHGGIIPRPGEPASHGCIRLPKDFVPTVFEVVDVGTPVVITNAPSERAMPGMESSPSSMPGQVPVYPQNWSGGGGGVQSVRYYNGLPVGYP